MLRNKIIKNKYIVGHYPKTVTLFCREYESYIVICDNDL